MQLASSRFVSAALWPATIWLSLSHFSEHPTDDYVERTSPIAAFAVGFWCIAASLAGVWFSNGPYTLFQVLLFFLPLVYLIGLWMISARNERYPG